MKAKVRIILFWFILSQPFLDLYWFYHGRLANLLPFTLPTIIRLAAMAVITALFFSQKGQWSKLAKNKWLLFYLILLLVYSLLHLWHVQTFRSVSHNNYTYSTTGEVFYLVRMSLPLLLLYFTQQLHFTQNQFKQITMGLSGLFSGTIVLTNLTLLSLRSYGAGLISGNLFTWLMPHQLGYSHLASKGWFNFSNMTSAVLLMLLPLMLYFLFTAFNWLITSLTIIQALAMLELGTKVAAFGLIGGLLTSFILALIEHFFFEKVVLKKAAIFTTIGIELGALVLIPFSPAIQRYRYENYLASQSDQELQPAQKILKAGLRKYPQSRQRNAFLRAFIKKNYHTYALNQHFVLKSYPYQEDPNFWLKIMQQPGQRRMQNRYLEQAMLNQVVINNHNSLDRWLGISYMRENHIFNLERDFSSQIISLGWSGMILFLGPQVITWAYGVFSWLRWQQEQTYLVSSLLLSLFFMLAAAFASGNVMDFLTASLILAFVNGYLLTILLPLKQGKRPQK